MLSAVYATPIPSVCLSVTRVYCIRTAARIIEILSLSDRPFIFTVRRYALHGLCDRNSVCLSVCLSVCHTRALCPHGSTYGHDFFTIW